MSLASTYNSIKQLLVSKLSNKGVTANTSQGLTTLIGKIEDIEDTLPTSITGDSVTGVYAPDVNIPISTTLKVVHENDDEISVDAPLENADVHYTFVGSENYYSQTETTDSNGVTSFNFSTDEMDTYTVLVNFLESKPFEAVSDFVLGTITIFEAIINYFQNTVFTHSGGGSSRNVSYSDNESVTMTTQAFEEDDSICQGAEVDYLTLTNPTGVSDIYTLVDTVITDTDGYTSYEYEAQGVGEVYIKAQSHKDSTICTEPYLISDWVKKDLEGLGSWVAFSGRVNTFSSNTSTTFTQRNGSKGGVHSQNTVFSLPDDDYVVSFKLTDNGGTSTRIGLHSSNYTDHHEKAVIGIEKDSSGGTFKFTHSTSSVTTVTKVDTTLTTIPNNSLVEFEVIDDTVKMYLNSTLYVTATLDWLHTSLWLYGQSWGSNNGSLSITDFCVKRIL